MILEINFSMFNREKDREEKRDYDDDSIDVVYDTTTV